jgi:hypothetical protein
MNSGMSKANHEARRACPTCDTSCQRCQKGKMLHVVFGYITSQMMEDEAGGRYALGGCLMPTSPAHRCNTCAASVGGDELAALWRKSRS